MLIKLIRRNHAEFGHVAVTSRVSAALDMGLPEKKVDHGPKQSPRGGQAQGWPGPPKTHQSTPLRRSVKVPDRKR